MIRSRYLHVIVGVALVVACVLTAILWLKPSLLGVYSSSSQPEYVSLFDPTQVMTIDIQIDEENWQDLLENATDEEYYPCDLVINGTTYASVGIRAKGNSSLREVAQSDSDRYSFKFDFDQYVAGQNCMGLDKFVVNNIQADATYMKEYLSYDLLNYIGVPTPLYAFANITVNGEPWGCYLAIEALEESFAQRQFGINHGQLYKPESDQMGGGGGGGMPAGDRKNSPNENPKAPRENQPSTIAEAIDVPEDHTASPQMDETTSAQLPQESQQTNRSSQRSSGGTNLIYVDDEIDTYSTIWEGSVFQTNDSDYKRVITALKNLNAGTNLETYVDVDEVLRYIAANTVLVNLDSYFSNMTHNYYLYEEDGQLAMLPWDYNLSFGAFQSNASSTINFPIDTPVSGVSMEERPMIGQLLAVDEYRERYHEYLQQIVDGYFNSGYFFNTIDRLDQLIATLVENDATAFYSYEEYQASLPMLKLWGQLRVEGIQGQLNGTIPSTSEGQKQDSSALVDASKLNMSVLGSQGGGGGNRQKGDQGTAPSRENATSPPLEPTQASTLGVDDVSILPVNFPISGEMGEPQMEVPAGTFQDPPVQGENEPPIAPESQENFNESILLPSQEGAVNLLDTNPTRRGMASPIGNQREATSGTSSSPFLIYMVCLVGCLAGIIWVFCYKRK